MLCLTVGKIALGFLYDRFGAMAGNAAIILCCLIFPVAALYSHIPALPWVYAVTAGIASCGFSVPVPILILKYFGTRDYPMMLSLFTMITTLGPAAATPLMGAVYDNSGSYKSAWHAILILTVLIAACLAATEILYKAKSKASAGADA
jgi:MFS family permease